MILSRAKPALQTPSGQGQGADGADNNTALAKAKKKIPSLKDFLKDRDYTGAMSLLDFERNSGTGTTTLGLKGQGDKASKDELTLWLAYCAFHAGDYKRALLEYDSIRNLNRDDVKLNLACTYFYLGMYAESEKNIKDIKATKDKNQLKTRMQFHLSHKFADEKKLMSYHQELEDIVEDQLSLASIHYLRSHYQEAIDIYKRILLDNREYLALNVYVALCYYKLDYYDVSQEVLAVYLQHFPTSVIAMNLKACNHFRLYNGKAAEQELKTLMQDHMSSPTTFGKDLLQHNLVVFRNGEGALQTLPPLVDVIPEARLNLVIYLLKQDDVNEAYELIKNLEPTVPQEYILKGVVNAAVGQESNSREHLKIAQQYFQLVGGSASECDTIPGRQCMAACFFLLKQFDDVLLYLNSIKSYFYNDDTFNFNYGQAKAAVGNYVEAEEILLQIQSEKIQNDLAYLSWLARCCIMNGKARIAWELYLKMETSGESFSLLQLIANDCYKMGQFFYAAKAFDMLERLDPNPEYWEGKRGAAVGHFQMVIAGKEERQSLADIVQILKNSSNPQADHIVKVMKKWAKDNRLQI